MIRKKKGPLRTELARRLREQPQTATMELLVPVIMACSPRLTDSAIRSVRSAADMVSAADLVLVMEAGHRRAIDDADPTARGKVYRIGEWQDRDIKDPYRKERDAYEAALRDIQAGVASWVEKIRA